MRLSSPAFKDGDAIPFKYTDDGCNSSPPIRWHDVPENAAELVLIVEDADAPREDPRIHWIVYKIPADSGGLPQGVPPHDQLTTPPGALQGANDFPSNHRIGYHGPAPSQGNGTHRYRFRLFALNEPLSLPPGAPLSTLYQAMADHIVAETSFIAFYERP